MKKTGRKMLGLILAISMVCIILPIAATAATIEGLCIKLEELDYSNREAGFSQNNSVGTMSGGKVRVNWATTYGELDFTVNIPVTGKYVIWVYGGDSSNSYVSPSKLVLDNTTDLNWESIQDSVQESGMSFKTAYHKVTANLTAGTHTLKYILTDVRPAGTYYAGAFDFMMIMPSFYTWTPAKDTFPTVTDKCKSFTEGGYAWIEELDYWNREAGFSQNNSVEAMSGGKVRVNWATTYGELEFVVNIPETGEYKIWVHGGESGNSSVSPSKLVLDGTTDLNWETIQDGTKETGMSFRTAYHLVTVNLTKGVHIIKYILTSARPADSYYAGAFDFMVIMPSNYVWTPSKDTYPVAFVKPEKVTEDGDVTVADAITVADTSAFAGSVTADAELLSNKTNVYNVDGTPTLYEGTYKIAFGANDFSGVTNAPDKFGMALYCDDSFVGIYEAKSVIGNKWGILFYGLNSAKTYTMKPYVQYDGEAAIISQ